MNRAERRRKERESKKANKTRINKIYSFDDFKGNEENLEKVYVCENCGLKHVVEYTEMPIIICIECSCGNQKAVQINKGFITWKMPNSNV